MKKHETRAKFLKMAKEASQGIIEGLLLPPSPSKQQATHVEKKDEPLTVKGCLWTIAQGLLMPAPSFKGEDKDPFEKFEEDFPPTWKVAGFPSSAAYENYQYNEHKKLQEWYQSDD